MKINFLKFDGINLLKLEIFGSFIILSVLFCSQLYYNFYKPIDFIIIVSFFISYYFLSFLETKYNNIFLRLLNLFFIIFFLMRMSFLPFENVNYSSIFFHNKLANDPFLIKYIVKVYNYANLDSVSKYLIILNFHYISLGACLLIFRPKKVDFNLEYVKRNYIYIILSIITFQMLLILIYYSFFPISNTPEKNIALLKIFFHIFNLDKIYVILTFLLLLVFNLNYKKKDQYLVVFLLIISILFAVIYFFSKSSILEASLYISLFYFLIDRKFFIKKNFIKFIVLYLILFFLLFIIAKFYRVIWYRGFNIDSFINHLNTIPLVLFTIFERIGFFDYYMFIVSNEETLKNLFVYDRYLKIIIDKTTPFFDLFNTMLLSRELHAIFHGINHQVLQSYQITLFAEIHLLFGYYFIIFYIIFALILKFTFDYLNNIKINNNLKIILIFFVIKSYFFYLIGYGMDTLIINVIYDSVFIISVLIGFKFLNYFYKKYVG